MQLIELSKAGPVHLPALRDLGRTVVGVDLDAARWPLAGKGMVVVPSGVGMAALQSAVASAHTPQRVRVGREWIKGTSGTVDANCVPSALAPDLVARWLRATCIREVRRVVTPTRPSRESAAPHYWAPIALQLVGDFTTRAAQGPEETVLVAEFLERLAALLPDRARVVLRLTREGDTPEEVAARLGCSDRTVRRWLERITERGRRLDAEPTSECEVAP